MRLAVVAIASMFVIAGVARDAQSQPAPAKYPSQVIRMVVPFTPGASTDVTARLFAQHLSAALGQQVIIDNRGGAGGGIGAELVAKAEPDGYTLLASNQGPFLQTALLRKDSPFAVGDFVPIAFIGYSPLIVVANLKFPPNDVKEMVAYAKAHPDKINRGSPGASILTNLAPLAFEGMAGIRTTHIPFNGDSPGLQALLGSQIDIQGTSITGPLQHIKAGKMRVLGVMDAKRLPQVPDAPTFKEQGYDIEALLWYALSAPAATPTDTIDKLNRAVNQVLLDPDFIARSQAIGMEPRGGTPQALAAYVKAETERWVPLLQRLDLPKQGH